MKAQIEEEPDGDNEEKLGERRMIMECSRSFLEECVDPHFHDKCYKLREREREGVVPEVGRRNRERKSEPNMVWKGIEEGRKEAIPIKKERYV